MTRFNALLVGLGQIGCAYDADLTFLPDQPRSSIRTLTHARALSCHPGFETVAGIDPNDEARHIFSSLYAKPSYPDLASWREAQTDQSLDLVVIAAGSNIQPKLVETLLDITLPRVLLLEKPVANSVDEASQLQSICADYPDLLVAVNYIRRYLPTVLR